MTRTSRTQETPIKAETVFLLLSILVNVTKTAVFSLTHCLESVSRIKFSTTYIFVITLLRYPGELCLSFTRNIEISYKQVCIIYKIALLTVFSRNAQATNQLKITCALHDSPSYKRPIYSQQFFKHAHNYFTSILVDSVVKVEAQTMGTVSYQVYV